MKVISVAVGWGGRPGERVERNLRELLEEKIVLKDNFVCLVSLTDNY